MDAAILVFYATKEENKSLATITQFMVSKRIIYNKKIALPDIDLCGAGQEELALSCVKPSFEFSGTFRRFL